MHLTLGFLGSNTDFGLPGCLSSTQKPSKNHSGTACLFEPYFFRYFPDFAAILGANMTPKTPSGGHPRAAQELCHTAHEPCKTAFNTRPERSRPPRASQTSKMTPKSRWGTPPSLIFAPTWMHLDPLTQLLCDFVRGAVAGSQLCCAVGSAAPGLWPAHGVQSSFILMFLLIFLSFSYPS